MSICTQSRVPLIAGGAGTARVLDPDVGTGAFVFSHEEAAKRGLEVREFELGRFELVHLGGMTIGRATYQPGWKWSEHVGRPLGQRLCQVEHVGMVLSGCATAAIEGGEVIEMRAGSLFYIPPGPPGHDSWVVGDEPYVSLHFMGAEDYAAHD